MAALADRLREDLNRSRKAQNKALTLLLGTVLSDIENQRILLKRDLSDDDVVEVIRRGIKRRRESVEAFDKGARPELAAQERGEISALEQYVPAAASEEDLRAAVKAAIAAGGASVAAVMGTVVPMFRGRADGGMINRIAREELGTSA